jgi:hypothetical protein
LTLESTPSAEQVSWFVVEEGAGASKSVQKVEGVTESGVSLSFDVLEEGKVPAFFAHM